MKTTFFVFFSAKAKKIGKITTNERFFLAISMIPTMDCVLRIRFHTSSNKRINIK